MHWYRDGPPGPLPSTSGARWLRDDPPATLNQQPPTQSLGAPPHLSVDDHHTHKHAEEHKGGKQDKDDGERAAQNQIPGIQLLLQVCPAIDLLRQGK